MRIRVLGLGVLSLLLAAGCGNSDQSSDSEFSRYADPFLTPDASGDPVQSSLPSTQNLLEQVSNPREWISAGQLPKGLYDHASAAWEEFLYVSGGFGPGTNQGADVNTKEIYIYRILPDHTVTPSSVATLPPKSGVLEGNVHVSVLGIDGHAMAAWGGYLYLIGGKFQYIRTDCYPPDPASTTCGSETPTFWNHAILYAAIQRDGTLSDWKEATLPPAVGPYTPGAAVSNGTLYILGGWDGTSNKSTVVSAPLFSNGSPGPWHTETSLPVGVSKHAVAVSGTHIYVSGGSTGQAGPSFFSQGYSANVYYTSIQENHTLGFWRSASSLPDSRIDHKMVSVGSLLWIIGGRNVNEYFDGSGNYFDYRMLDHLLAAEVQNDGSLSSWIVYNALPTPLMRHSVAVDTDVIYLIGGSSAQDLDPAAAAGCDAAVSPCGPPYIREDGIYFLDLSVTF